MKKTKKIKPKPVPSKKRKKQQKRTTIKGQPVHIDKPKGLSIQCPNVNGYILRTTIARQFTLPQLTAARKCIRSKSVRKYLHIRTTPYLDKTKKPSEVRMGKGRGVKINVVITPLIAGQIMFEASSAIRLRNLIAVSANYHVAARKLPKGIKILRMDI